MPTYTPYDEENAQPSVDVASKYVPYEDKPVEPQTQAAKKQATTLEQVQRALGLFVRGGVTGITGVGGAIADAGAGAANLFGANLPMPSQEQQKMLTRLGLPEPQGALENAVQFGTSALAGGMDPALGAVANAASKLGAPANFVSPSSKASQNAVTKELHDAGYVLPPSEMNAGFVARTAEGLGGKQRTAQLAEFQNQEVTQKLAKKAVGLPETERLTADNLKLQADELIKQGYDPIRDVARINVGKSYRDALQKIRSEIGGSNSFPLAQRTEVQQLVDKYLYTGETQANGAPRYVQAYTGQDALKEVKLLRQSASAQFKPGGDPLQGEAMRRIATALEDNIEASLKGQGSKLVTEFRNARTELAKNFAVERMLTDPNTGVVDASKAARLLQSGTPLTGELKIIAKAGGPLYSRATGVPTGGKPPMINYGDSMLTGGGVGIGHMTGGVGYGVAAIPAARAAARMGVLSKPAQAMMAHNLTSGASLFGVPLPANVAEAGRIASGPVMAGMGDDLGQLFGGQ